MNHDQAVNTGHQITDEFGEALNIPEKRDFALPKIQGTIQKFVSSYLTDGVLDFQDAFIWVILWRCCQKFFEEHYFRITFSNQNFTWTHALDITPTNKFGNIKELE